MLERGCDDGVWAVMKDCWRFNPHERPSMREVVIALGLHGHVDTMNGQTEVCLMCVGLQLTGAHPGWSPTRWRLRLSLRKRESAWMMLRPLSTMKSRYSV